MGNVSHVELAGDDVGDYMTAPDADFNGDVLDELDSELAEEAK